MLDVLKTYWLTLACHNPYKCQEINKKNSRIPNTVIRLHTVYGKSQ